MPASESTPLIPPPTKDSVPLPRSGASKSVWQLDNPQAPTSSTATATSNPSSPTTRQKQLVQILGDQQPLDSKCGANHRNDGQCCKNLKGDDERHLISPEIVRDIIIGLSDGLTVPFALTAGLSSLGSSKLVVTGGLAELLAGALSMGLGGYLASKAELDHFHYLRKQTRARVTRSCAGEMEREVHSILGPLGVKEELSRLVAEDLRAIEDGSSGSEGGATGVEGVVATREPSPSSGGGKKGWFGRLSKGGEEDVEEGGVSGSEDLGLSAFLLKFGEGLEEVPVSRLYVSALTIGLSYFIGGLIPLIPYIITSKAQDGLIISVILTGVILFIFGGFKTYFTGATGGYLGYIWGATSTMIVGGVAAGAAYGLVKAMGVQE